MSQNVGGYNIMEFKLHLSQIILQWTDSELLNATKVMYLPQSRLQCETPNNVEEVDVPNVTVAAFMDVRKFKQFLWKKSFYMFFVTFDIEWVIEFLPLLYKS
jgi:hypothetical protein